MSINNVYKQSVYQLGSTTNPIYINCNDSYAVVTAPGYLAAQIALGLVVNAGDMVYLSNLGLFQPIVSVAGVVTLVRPVGSLLSIPVSCGFAALSTAGHVVIQSAVSGCQFAVREIRVMYSAAGLSGGSGNRLLSVTDGTTAFNSTGITAALLGTPINTLFGGTGNPVAGTVAQNTPSVAGSAIYAVYAGGTTDYTAGAVNLEVQLLRVA